MDALSMSKSQITLVVVVEEKEEGIAKTEEDPMTVMGIDPKTKAEEKSEIPISQKEVVVLEDLAHHHHLVGEAKKGTGFIS